MVDIDSDPDDQPKGDPEVTLGMASLLGIFFGLVVLCGIFFGFGYSVGKHYVPTAAHPTKTVAPAAAVADGAAPADQPSPAEPPAAKPSARGPELHAPANSSAANSPPPALPGPLPSKKVATPSTPSAQRTAVDEAASSAHPSERSPRNSAFPDYMVQIAAISRPSDGDALIAALRKRGYNVSAYTEPQDMLLHVQIGPFTTRAEANAMRQKLLADGYNAIIK